jgi:hypothetical protein
MSVAHRQRLRRLDKTARTFGVFFNIHRLISLSLPLRPERDQQKWEPVLRPIALQFLNERIIWSANRLHFAGSCAWHENSIFIGFRRPR